MPKPSFDKSGLLFAAAAIIFLLLKSSAAGYSISDENVYYKSGQLVAEGQAPYKDFFFAHLPLQVYIYAAVFKLAGFSIWLLKMLSALAMVAAAMFVFATAKGKASPMIAALAAALFLFSYGTLLFSNFPTGAEFGTAFAAAAFYFFTKGKNATAGILAGLGAAAYQLSVIAVVPMAAALLLRKERKATVKLVAGFAATLAIICLPFLLAAKWEFIRQTVIYHFQKPAEAVDKAAVFLRVIKTNWLLILLAVIGLRKKAALTAGAVALAYIAFFPLAKTAFNYYLLYAFPFLAICAAYGLAWGSGILVSKAKLTTAAATAIVIAFVIAASFQSASSFARYDFQDFNAAGEVAGYVKANSEPQQTIFGDDSTTPLISLLSGRDVALNYADNNLMRYKSGVTSMDETLERLEKDESLKFVILRKTILGNAVAEHGIGADERFAGFVAANCELAAEFSEESSGIGKKYEVYDCRKI